VGDDRQSLRTPAQKKLGFEIPSARAAMSGKTAYVALYRPVMESGFHNDIVVYRTDDTTFDALKDSLSDTASNGPAAGSSASCGHRDGHPGYRVQMCRRYPSYKTPDSLFGQEKHRTTELGIAVHPTDPTKVFVMWGETSPADSNHIKLLLSRSDNGGAKWTDTLWSVDHATNPALAIASDGAVGILYQRLETDSAKHHYWDTEIAISDNDFKNVKTHPPIIKLLARVRADSPKVQPQPYLGDYIHLEASGKNFYGVFPASNDRGSGNSFPYLCPRTTCPGQRPYNSLGHPVNQKGDTVKVSIDPYFFRVNR
jgi:hypothetical protein